MRRVSGATTGEVNGVRWQLGANYFEDAGFTGTARQRQDREQRRCARAAGVGIAGLASCLERRRHPGLVAVHRHRARIARPVRIGPGAALQRRRPGVARDHQARAAVALRWVQPWFGAGSRVRQRVEFDAADYDLTFKSAFGTSDGNTHRTHARVQTDVAASAAFGFSGGFEWLGERGGSTFITAGTRRRSARRARRARPVRRGPVERRRSRHRHRRRSRRAHHARRLAGRSAGVHAPAGFSGRDDRLGQSEDRRGVPASAGSLARPAARERGRGCAARSAPAFVRPMRSRSRSPTTRAEARAQQSGELGVTQALAGGAVQLDATAFFNSYDDLIVSVGRAFSGISRYRTDNISNARARGLEASAAAARRRRLRHSRGLHVSRQRDPRGQRRGDARRLTPSATRCCGVRATRARSTRRGRAATAARSCRS